MIEFGVLGSGSSGNSAVICHGETRILVDAGLSAKQLSARLEALGVDPDSLSAIVLTHEHGDHVQGLEVFCRKRIVPVYATSHTSHLVQESRIQKSTIAWRKFEAGSTFKIGDLTVESFNVPHDAVDPVGFVFRSPAAGSVGVLSDLGHVTRPIIERLKGVDSLFVESNYDQMMLQNDAKRPWSLKQRISNRHGHLSNEQTADLLRSVATPVLNRVVLGHLSSDCNTEEKALTFARDALREMGLSDVDVECAERKNPLALKPASKKSFSPVSAISENDEAIAAAAAAVAKNLEAEVEVELEPPENADSPAFPGPVLVEAKNPEPETPGELFPANAISLVKEIPEEKPAKSKEVCESPDEWDLVQMELAL